MAARLSDIYANDYEDEQKHWGFTEILMAGWCHDLLEDTDIDEEKLKVELGIGATRLVVGMTNVKYQVEDRAMQKFLDRQRLRGEPDDVKVIKLVDRLDNVQDLGDAKPDFQPLYAIESMALVDAILASTTAATWHFRVLKDLAGRIEKVADQYLPRALPKGEIKPKPVSSK